MSHETPLKISRRHLIAGAGVVGLGVLIGKGLSDRNADMQETKRGTTVLPVVEPFNFWVPEDKSNEFKLSFESFSRIASAHIDMDNDRDFWSSFNLFIAMTPEKEISEKFNLISSGGKDPAWEFQVFWPEVKDTGARDTLPRIKMEIFTNSGEISFMRMSSKVTGKGNIDTGKLGPAQFVDISTPDKIRAINRYARNPIFKANDEWVAEKSYVAKSKEYMGWNYSAAMNEYGYIHLSMSNIDNPIGKQKSTPVM